MTTTVLGHAVHRREDPGLLTGATPFVDDLPVAAALHAVFVRATVAHGVVRGVDTAHAAGAPGVHAVLTAADLDLRPASTMTREPALARPHLAGDRVRYVGEPVAVVLAASRAEAVDAAELVVVDVDPLPAVVDPLAALDGGAPVLFPDHGSNVVAGEAPGDDGSSGDPTSAPDGDADGTRVVRARLRHHRVAPVPMEPNALCAVPDGDGGVTVHASTQSVFGVRRELARVLGLDENRIRVAAPAVGGGFGAKGGVYPEQVVVVAAALRTGRPVRWAETRSENLVAMTHGRGQVQDVAATVAADGTVTALRVRAVADAGAYGARGVFIPYVTQHMASGVYRIPTIDFRPVVVVTNTTPTGPYRGAGRPEAAALVERTMDLVAHDLGLDPVAVRRRNFVPPDAFPYSTATGAVYDSGDYAASLDRALALSGYDELRRSQQALRANGARTLTGIGIACYVEVSGRGGEYGSVRVDDEGGVTVHTGSVPHGQGHETTWAQVASAVLGVEMERVRVVHSDTASVARGTGTFGSRSGQLAGSAVHRAAEAVWEQARRLAADILEAAVEDVTVHEGRVTVAGTPAIGLGWDALARAAAERGDELAAEVDFDSDGTYPSGTHIAVVEVDTETGATRLDRLVAVDDCGRLINPLVVEGQVHGGVAQGIAHTLFEAVTFDADGTPRSANLADYGMPSAADLPSFETAHTETLTPRNPLGVKGVGESGTTGATAAVWNAVVDALGPFGVRHLDPPFTAERVWRAMRSPT